MKLKKKKIKVKLEENVKKTKDKSNKRKPLNGCKEEYQVQKPSKR